MNGAFGSANGLYSYSSTSTFPTSSYHGSNYWVDPVFTPVPSAPGQVTNVSATAGRVGEPDVERAVQRRAGHHVHDHPVHRLRSPADNDGDGTPAGDERHRHRADRRHQLHLHGARRPTRRRRTRLRNSPMRSRRRR